MMSDNKVKIDFIDKLPIEIQKQRDLGHFEYESSKGIDCAYRRFAIVFRNTLNELIGVLEAYTAFAEIYIDDLWVKTEYRGNGYGRQLIETLENKFKNRGYNNINLCTSDFACPGFYVKCGFEIEFVRVNKYNPQFTKTFFIKYFVNENQNKGLLNE